MKKVPPGEAAHFFSAGVIPKSSHRCLPKIVCKCLRMISKEKHRSLDEVMRRRN